MRLMRSIVCGDHTCTAKSRKDGISCSSYGICCLQWTLLRHVNEWNERDQPECYWTKRWKHVLRNVYTNQYWLSLVIADIFIQTEKTCFRFSFQLIIFKSVTSVHQECCDFLERDEFQFKLDSHWYCHICAIAEKYGLREFRETAEKQRASNYQNICESEEFLTHISTEKLLSLLSRDDLTAPSETFVFKSVMKWIKQKKTLKMLSRSALLIVSRKKLFKVADWVSEVGIC